jgi:prepilin-type N-terminal cleavage/methylation domain-containing protein
MWEHKKEKANERGFTLVELLLALVVLGILTAVAIVGIKGLTGTSAGSACDATMDSAEAASAAYYTRWHTYPQRFSDLTNPPSRPLLDTQALVTAPNTLRGNGGWTLTLQPGSTTTDRTTFSGC